MLGKTTSQIEDELKQLGQPAFRGRQIAAWIYRRGASSFDEMTDLPTTLRETLRSRDALQFPEVAARFDSRDGSSKLLLEMQDGERIETVRLPYENRVSVCVSSQAGCAMACQFCATGMGGFRRNLSVAEIIAQPLLAMRAGETVVAPSHIVFMGMGEPLLNLGNVIPAIHLMHDEIGIALRNITVSTVGIVPGIKRLAEENLPVTLAVSLHAPDDDLRHRLIPTSRKTSVRQIVDAAKDYFAHTGRRVTFEYVLLGGVNDSADHARHLAKLCRGWQCHVNVIPWNDVPDAKLEDVLFGAPSSNAVREFKRVLEDAGVPITQRIQRGADVAAACGQLRALEETKSDIAFI